MNPRYLLLLTALSILPTANAETDADFTRAEARLLQVYDRHGGRQQAREQLRPVAEHKLRTCRLCHGADGNSTRTMLPSLAGERAEYLLKRWYELIAGHGESSTAIKMARRIDEDEMIALALYFSAQRWQAHSIHLDEHGQAIAGKISGKQTESHPDGTHGTKPAKTTATQQRLPGP